MRKITLLSVLFCLIIYKNNAQVVFEHISKTTIYEYLDEMANIRLIELNSSIKPYTRQFIAEKLLEIQEKQDKLNKRQKGELTFFLRDYSKELKITDKWDWLGRKVVGKNRTKFKDREKRIDLFYHRDSLFTISINPILGTNFWYGSKGLTYHRWNGAEMFAYIGKHLGIYANLRDNYENKILSDPSFLNQISSAPFKYVGVGNSPKAVEYEEMRGGITYSWKWGYFGVVKEHNVWGNNYNGSNIISNRGPSYAQIKLNLKPTKWIEFNYFHAWLASQVVDSSRTQIYGTGISNVYVPKYIAMNMFTIKPIRSLHFSIGNSMIYSQNMHAGYFIPFIFFKALDHTYSTLGNSAMFFDISIRSLRKVHLYATGYIDELAIGRMLNKNTNTNFWSGKVGLRLSNIIPNVTLTGEYTITNPIAYKHYNPETTYANAGYTLGNYLRDNAQDMYFQISYKPFPRLKLSASYNHASKGPDYPDNRVQLNPTTNFIVSAGLPFQESLIWESTTIGGQVSYEVLNDIHIRVGAQYTDIWDPSRMYTPKVFIGKQINTTCTLSWGF